MDNEILFIKKVNLIIEYYNKHKKLPSENTKDKDVKTLGYFLTNQKKIIIKIN